LFPWERYSTRTEDWDAPQLWWSSRILEAELTDFDGRASVWARYPAVDEASVVPVAGSGGGFSLLVLRVVEVAATDALPSFGDCSVT
jgi:hypothetical protein